MRTGEVWYKVKLQRMTSRGKSSQEHPGGKSSTSPIQPAPAAWSLLQSLLAGEQERTKLQGRGSGRPQRWAEWMADTAKHKKLNGSRTDQRECKKKTGALKREHVWEGNGAARG